MDPFCFQDPIPDDGGGKLQISRRKIMQLSTEAFTLFRASYPLAYGEWAVLKFAAAPGATPPAGYFTPRTSLTRQAAVQEPHLLVATDPGADHQPPTGAS